MAKRTLRWGRLLGSLLILFLLVAGGLWFYRSQSRRVEVPPSSPVLVFLLSPSSGDEAEAGDYVPVTLQAAAPKTILSAELFVDGKSLGEVTNAPESASWTWQAWPVGIHTLSARATAADGQMGQSQTVILNVLAGDGTMQIAADEGQTLEQIGADFGAPPDQMAGANPHVDPSQPLTGGQPVQVPVGEENAGGGGAGNGSGAGSGQGQPPGGADSLIPISIIWQFKPSEPVDKSYCYTSSGNGVWEKMPKNPFYFFQSLDNLYTQFFPQQVTVIQMQCWGWLGDALKYLGQGETQFDLSQPPNEVMISGEGFQFLGIPQIPIPEEKFTGGGGNNTIPPPLVVREATDAVDCSDHHPLYDPSICNLVSKAYLNTHIKEYLVLVWEWEPESCWPGYCKYGINEIDGYRISEIDPLTKSVKHLKEIIYYSNHAFAVPLPWGYRCYGITAYIKEPAIESAMTTYCPGEPPTPQEITLTPTDWLTAATLTQGGSDNDGTVGAEDKYTSFAAKHFGGQAGAVLVGHNLVDDEDFYWLGYYSGGVKFDLPLNLLPPGAVIQKAVLKFSVIYTEYYNSDVASPAPVSCVWSVGKAKQDWSGLSSGNHFSSKNVLAGPAYNEISVSNKYFPPEVDVTYAVKAWIKNPSVNHGFTLGPVDWLYGAYLSADEECKSGLGNFQLEIYYFAP